MGPKAWKTFAAVVGHLASAAWASEVLETNGFVNCGHAHSAIKIEKIDISYDKDDKLVTFDLAGFTSLRQNVTALLQVSAYGESVYSKSFNPCDRDSFVEKLCPVPAGSFSARGSQQIPPQYANMVPAMAFQVPDIAAQATLKLNSLADGREVACIQSQVTNGKTVEAPAVKGLAIGITGVALVMAIATSIGNAASGSVVPSASPSFCDIFSHLQGMAMNGMLSVNYPPVYRSFIKNFAFSVGIFPWVGVQSSIDNFRAKTGGNLTEDNVEYLRNATLVFTDGSISSPGRVSKLAKRAWVETLNLSARGVEASINSSDSTSATTPNQDSTNLQQTVKGIQAYAEQLSVPKSDIFMSALLIVSLVIAAIVIGLLLVKAILELWALFGNFPKALAGFRKHYWGTIARTITSLVLLLYGVWVLYCVFQFTNGDSWAAKALAGLTLALFTAILAFFSWKIWTTVRTLRNREGDANALYDDKKIWVKYSLFYESYKKDYWWLFIPAILYMFAKGCALAATDGHGMTQTIAMLTIEALMLALLLCSRPFERKSSNVINIVIAVVRLLSVACILVFVEEFGIKSTTKTVTGVVLIVIQSLLTGVLAVLIAWNAINACCKANPHRKRRKETEQLQRDLDNLTPLDARNSLLLERLPTNASQYSFATDLKEDPLRGHPATSGRWGFPAEKIASRPSPGLCAPDRPVTPVRSDEARQNLVDGAAPMGAQSSPPTLEREYRGAYRPARRFTPGSDGPSPPPYHQVL